MPTVFSTGSVIVDVAVAVPHLPDKGGDVLASEPTQLPGGGFNLAAAVARYGVRCFYAGRIGDGRNGALVAAALDSEGIGYLSPVAGAGDTGTCFTLIEADGERTFITAPGAESKLDSSWFDSVIVADDDLVSVSGYDLAYLTSGAALSGWISRLPSTCIVAFDPGPLVDLIPRELLEAVLIRADILTLNQREARMLARTPGASGADLVSAVTTSLPASARRVVIVREGKDGCVATGGALESSVVAVPAPEVVAVDTTGAGDAHTGVLLACLAAGLELLDAIAIANRAAALTVTKLGPATSPTLSELGNFAHG